MYYQRCILSRLLHKARGMHGEQVSHVLVILTRRLASSRAFPSPPPELENMLRVISQIVGLLWTPKLKVSCFHSRKYPG